MTATLAQASVRRAQKRYGNVTPPPIRFLEAHVEEIVAERDDIEAFKRGAHITNAVAKIADQLSTEQAQRALKLGVDICPTAVKCAEYLEGCWHGGIPAIAHLEVHVEFISALSDDATAFTTASRALTHLARILANLAEHQQRRAQRLIDVIVPEVQRGYALTEAAR